MKELKILHYDPDFLVINKPGGLLAVPGRGINKQDCVVNRAKTLFPGCMEQPAVHRLDMATSGIMLLARNSRSHRRLSRQFESRQVRKEYLAIVDGVITKKQGSIELAFRLDPDNRPHQIYDPLHGKTGLTHWEKLESTQGKTLIRFTPVTGRTHQLRLHASHPKGLGVPIVGDFLYGNAEDGATMFLHASRLFFLHPENGKGLEFNSSPPWLPMVQ